MDIVAVVHAKGSSKRLENKNIRKLGPYPLFVHAICNAKLSKATQVVIDSEDEHILGIGKQYGATPLKRPIELASNLITGDDLAYWQATNFPEADCIVQVVPTSPFTKPATINKCIDSVVSGEYNSAFTGNWEKLYMWGEVYGDDFQPLYIKEGKIPNSTELQSVFVEYTGLFAFTPDFALEYKQRIDDYSFATITIDPFEKIDINYEDDFKLAEAVWRGLHESEYPDGEE